MKLATGFHVLTVVEKISQRRGQSVSLKKGIKIEEEVLIYKKIHLSINSSDKPTKFNHHKVDNHRLKRGKMLFIMTLKMGKNLPQL